MELVVRVRMICPRSVLVRVTVAALMTAPVESGTGPLMLPLVAPWAPARVATLKSMARIRLIRVKAFVFIHGLLSRAMCFVRLLRRSERTDWQRSEERRVGKECR